LLPAVQLASVLVASVAIACSGELTVCVWLESEWSGAERVHSFDESRGQQWYWWSPTGFGARIVFFFLQLKPKVCLVLCCSNWFGNAGDSCF
jgi:hypothetical protein